MIKTKICPKCGSYYDDTLPECPSCHQRNDERAYDQKGPGLINMPNSRHVLSFIVGWIGLDFIAIFVRFVIKLILTNQYANDTVLVDNALDSAQIQMILNFVSYFLLFVCLTALCFPYLRMLIKDFKKIRPYVVGVVYGFLLIAAGSALGIIYKVLGIQTTDNANEEAVVAMMKASPLLSVLAFVIAGPLCEEITYRLGLFTLLRKYNRFLAYVVVVIFFGLIHFSFTSTAIVNELLNLPYYMMAGAILSYAYEREGLATSMVAHVTNNLISFISSLLYAEVAGII